MQVLMKWGEYSSDVHFILQRTALDPSASSAPGGHKQSAPANNKTGRPVVQSSKAQVDPLHGFTPPAQVTAPSATTASTATISPAKDLKKSLTFSGGTARPVDGVRSKQADETDDRYGHHKVPNGRSAGDGWTEPSPAPGVAHSAVEPANDANQLVYPRYEPPYGRLHQQSNVNGTVSPVDHAQQDHVRFPPPYRNPPPPSGNHTTGPRQSRAFFH